MNTTYITFGTDHNEQHAHLVDGARLSDGWVAIEAPTHEIGRSIAFAIFGPAFAFSYDEIKRPDLYHLGEILRIHWGEHAHATDIQRQLIQQEFDRRANSASYDTSHTSRPDAMPTWDDLTPSEQDETVEIYLEQGWV